MSKIYLLGTVLLLLIAGAGYAWYDWYWVLPAEQHASYVGSNACAKCHQGEFQKWTGSHHQLAMQIATPESVRGNFDNQTLEHFGVKSRMFRQGDNFCMETEGATGKLETWTIKYTFGVEPLQQYLVEFPNGRLQVLPISWDTVGKRWFHIYPDEPIRPQDPLHWTGWAQTWNHMCADCHSTNLQRNYDAQQNKYATTFSEISVGCEGCHGPGSNHVELASKKSWFWDRTQGKGLTVTLKDPKNTTQINTCAQCHSLSGTIAAELRPGKAFHDHRTLQLIDGVQFFDDGQIQGEVFEHASFLQSKMFHKNIKCTDCHAPHTSKLKLPGNQLCTSCHAHPVGKYDSPVHHHHQVGSTGSQCVECHMPHRTYMVVHDRRDHSLRVPRPDLSVKLGTPNACNLCHDKIQTPNLAGKSSTEQATWAAEQIVAWYGPKRAVDPHYGEILQAARLGKPESVAELIKLVNKADLGINVRASAINYLGQFRNGPLDAEISKALLIAIKDPEPLIRATAVNLLNAEQLRSLGRTILLDDSRLVRFNAARLISALPNDQLPGDLFPIIEALLKDYEATQQIIRDTPEANLNLAQLASNQQKYDLAERYTLHALQLLPQAMPAVQQQAEILSMAGKNADAERVLRAGIKQHDALLEQWRTDEPLLTTKVAKERRTQDLLREQTTAADLRASLAKVIAERGELAYPEAITLFTDAIKLDANLPRLHYNLGCLQHFTKQEEPAEQSLRIAMEREPTGVDVREMLCEVLLARQNATAAEELLITSLQTIPAGRMQLTVRLAQLYLEQQRYEAAEQLLTAVLKRTSNPQLIELLVAALRGQGKTEAAAPWEQQLRAMRRQ